MKKPFRIMARLRSVQYAATGVWTMLRSQHNAWLHALSTIIICSLGLYFGLSRWEWCAIVLAIGGVWAAEAVNTAFEFLADVASPDFNPLVKKSKDVAAGAVLIAALAAVIIGLLVLGPYCLAVVASGG